MAVAAGVRSLRGGADKGGAGTEGVVGTEEGMVLAAVAAAPASNMGVSPPASVVGTRTALVLLLREDFRVGAGLSVTIREGFSAMQDAQNLEGKVKNNNVNKIKTEKREKKRMQKRAYYIRMMG